MKTNTTDIIDKYFAILKMCKENIKNINERDNATIPEQENLYLYTFCSILCVSPELLNKNNDEIILNYKDEEYSIAESKIQNILKDSYENIIEKNILFKNAKALKENTSNENKEINSDEHNSMNKIEKDISFDKEIEKEKENEISFDNEIEDDFLGRNEFKQIANRVMDDLPETIENKSNESNTTLQVNDNTVIENKPAIEFVEDSDPYKRSINHFVFNIHDLKIKHNNGIESTMRLLIYPTTIEENKRPSGILAAIIQDERIKMAYTSKNSKSRSLELIFDDCGFYISGCWEDGKFKTRVSENSNQFQIISNDIFENTYNVLPTTFGKVLKLNAYNMEVEFYPLNTTNNLYSGLVPSVAIKRTDEGEEVLLPEDDLISIVTEGKYVQVETYWMGDEYIVFEKR